MTRTIRPLNASNPTAQFTTVFHGVTVRVSNPTLSDILVRVGANDIPTAQNADFVIPAQSIVQQTVDSSQFCFTFENLTYVALGKYQTAQVGVFDENDPVGAMGAIQAVARPAYWERQRNAIMRPFELISNGQFVPPYALTTANRKVFPTPGKLCMLENATLTSVRLTAGSPPGIAQAHLVLLSPDSAGIYNDGITQQNNILFLNVLSNFQFSTTPNTTIITQLPNPVAIRVDSNPANWAFDLWIQDNSAGGSMYWKLQGTMVEYDP